MDIGQAFKYPFEDERWTEKLGIGALLYFVPILNFAIAGFTVQIERRVAYRDPRPMPGWSDLGALFMDGLMLTLAIILYALPSALLIGLGMVVGLFLGILFGAAVDPLVGFLLGMMVFALFVVVNWAYSLVVSVLIPAITIQYARWGNFGACFKFGQMIALIRSNPGGYFTAWAVKTVGAIALATLLMPVGMILSFIPLIGTILMWVLYIGAYFYLALITAHVYGQLMAETYTEIPEAA